MPVDPSRMPRSPELMSAADTGLLIIDVQQKLVPLVAGAERIVWNIDRLLTGAQMFGVQAIATEQYPKGLGPTVDPLRSSLGAVFSKTSFSALGAPELCDELRARPNGKWLVAGIESHVCVQQTVLDLACQGFRVYVAIDAIGARHEIDHQQALRRMESAGATLTTTEAALFEWCQDSTHPRFKELSELIKSPSPSPNYFGLIGSIDDETFVRPPQGEAPPPVEFE